MISVETLRTLPYFGGVSSESLRAVAEIADEREFQAGQVVFQDGAASQTLYFIQHGEIDIIYTLQGGRQCVVDTVVGGDLVGWSSLVPPYQTTAIAAARTAVRAVCIQAPSLRQLCDRDPALGYCLMGHVAATLSDRLRGALVQLAASG